MTDDEQPNEDATELVLQKEGRYVRVWAVVGGEQVFSAVPPVTAAGNVIQAAVKTFLTRGWEQELSDWHSEDDNSKDGWFR